MVLPSVVCVCYMMIDRGFIYSPAKYVFVVFFFFKVTTLFQTLSKKKKLPRWFCVLNHLARVKQNHM